MTSTGTANRILVVGGVTIDTIHLPHKPDPLVRPGGAGLFTARGAIEAGGPVTLFAQRPDPTPDLLVPHATALDWIGPVIPVNDLPRLEIVHFGGGKAELRSAYWGAQLNLSPKELPDDLSCYAYVHIAALGPTRKQIDFVRECRRRGANGVTAGTYGRAAYGEPQQVRILLSLCDAFFMNRNEAFGLFRSLQSVGAGTGQLIFVTLGADGAVCVTPSGQMHANAPKTEEENPTGAGDVFCGAALTALAGGGSPREALEAGVGLASAHVGGLV